MNQKVIRINPKRIHSTNKSHSAVCSDEETKEKLLEISCDKDDYSSCDEEQKILDEISDDENDISFNLDEDFDIFNERSETIYSKKDKFDNIKAKDFILKKWLRSTELGKVYLAEHKNGKKLYALKSIKKDQFLKRFKSIDILKDLSDQLDHPFIWTIDFAIQNEFRVYLISDLLKGGELENLIK